MASVTQGTAGAGSTESVGVDAQMASIFASSLTAMNTPDSLGWALVNHVLSEGVTKGTVNGDKVEVPCMVTVTLPHPSTDQSGDFVSEVCITVLGHQIACIQVHSHAQSH